LLVSYNQTLQDKVDALDEKHGVLREKQDNEIADKVRQLEKLKEQIEELTQECK
jgi:flagellar hook-associated protein FlgK